jgi:hypothetical protein
MHKRENVEMEGDLLTDTTGLVVILQEEAEELVLMANIVEEYAEEVYFEAELERWNEVVDREIGELVMDVGLEVQLRRKVEMMDW